MMIVNVIACKQRLQSIAKHKYEQNTTWNPMNTPLITHFGHFYNNFEFFFTFDSILTDQKQTFIEFWMIFRNISHPNTEHNVTQVKTARFASISNCDAVSFNSNSIKCYALKTKIHTKTFGRCSIAGGNGYTHTLIHFNVLNQPTEQQIQLLHCYEWYVSA